MKRIVICCDGTWNRSDQAFATNVVKLRDALLPRSASGIRQAVYYQNGVGTRSLIDKLPGGVFGSGLWQNVQSAYEYVVRYYELGDEIFLFGFSRGAYTARSIVGMVRKCGILKPDGMERIKEAYDFYRNRQIKPGDLEARAFRDQHAIAISDQPPAFNNVPPVKFVGVWDTVGSLGIPLGTLGKVFNRRHRFHDVSLSRIVANACQALAIDEHRRPFAPTLWERHPQAMTQVLEQRWFAGVHTSIGGGNADARQSDRALLWMMSRARSCGLEFDEEFVTTKIQDDIGGGIPTSLFHEVARHVPFNMLTYVRPIGAGVPIRDANYLGGLSEELIDPAVLDRNVSDPSYMPPGLVSYFRSRPEVLTQLQGASRAVWP
jgi:uncharacterized protein (DUF2235 family)